MKVACEGGICLDTCDLDLNPHIPQHPRPKRGVQRLLLDANMMWTYVLYIRLGFTIVIPSF